MFPQVGGLASSSNRYLTAWQHVCYAVVVAVREVSPAHPLPPQTTDVTRAELGEAPASFPQLTF